MSNSFQKWACRKLWEAGICGRITFISNWIAVNGDPIMSCDGVRRYIQSKQS